MKNKSEYKRLGIITFQRSTNFGGLLFVYSLKQLFEKNLNNINVEIIDYRPLNYTFHEYIKIFGIMKKIPLYNFRRLIKCNIYTENLLKNNKQKNFFREKKLRKYIWKNFDILVTAMDVWHCNSLKEFPQEGSPYWLPYERKLRFSFAISAYRSDIRKIKTNQNYLVKLLSNYKYHFVRDNFTKDILIQELQISENKISSITDPTFYYNIKKTGIVKKFPFLNKPCLGIEIPLSIKIDKIKRKFKDREFLLVSSRMYVPGVINIGHKISPEEWAEIVGYYDFFITDRFHGVIFALKNNIPFVVIDKENRSKSKIFDIIKQFDLEDFCYINLNDNKKDEISQRILILYNLQLKNRMKLKTNINKKLIKKEKNLVENINKFNKFLEKY